MLAIRIVRGNRSVYAMSMHMQDLLTEKLTVLELALAENEHKLVQLPQMFLRESVCVCVFVSLRLRGWGR